MEAGIFEIRPRTQVWRNGNNGLENKDISGSALDRRHSRFSKSGSISNAVNAGLQCDATAQLL